MSTAFFRYPYAAGMRVQLKKKHPCGSAVWTVVRAGAEVRLVCTGCGREQVMTRRQLEQATRAVIPGDGDEA